METRNFQDLFSVLGFFFSNRRQRDGICNCFYNFQEEDTLHDILKFKKMTRRSKILYKWLDKKKQNLV